MGVDGHMVACASPSLVHGYRKGSTKERCVFLVAYSLCKMADNQFMRRICRLGGSNSAFL
jgi:hypothetical protein